MDNGINRYDTDQPPRYVNNTHLSSRVGRLNLDWIDPDQSQEKENEAFQRAMALAGKEFLEVRYLLCNIMCFLVFLYPLHWYYPRDITGFWNKYKLMVSSLTLCCRVSSFMQDRGYRLDQS